MLSPEVISFPAPRSCFQAYECELPNFLEKFKVPGHGLIPRLFQTIKVFIPLAEEKDDDVDLKIGLPFITYDVMNLPLYLLLEVDFIEAFIKRGKLVAVPKQLCGLEDWVVLTPDGKLELHLRKDHSQMVGIPPDTKIKTNDGHRVFVVNMLDPNFRKGKKQYDVLFRFLTEVLPLRNSLLMKWIPSCDSICSSSVAAYWDGKGFEVTVASKERQHTFGKSKMPLVNETDPYDLVEWVAAVAHGIKESGLQDNYISTFHCPVPNIKLPAIGHYEISGLFLPSELNDWFTKLEEQLRGIKIEPWANVSLFAVDCCNPKLISIFLQPKNQNSSFSCLVCHVEEGNTTS